MQLHLSDLLVTTLPPVFFWILWYTDTIALATFKLSLVGCFVFFVIFPLIFRYSYKIQRGLLFMTFINYPPNLDLKRPDKLGLYGTRNFYITYRDPKRDIEVRIGTWHVLPNHIVRRFARQLQIDETTLSSINQTEKDVQLDAENEAKYQQIESALGKDFRVDSPEREQQFYEQVFRTTTGDVILYLHGNTGSRGAPHRVELYQLLRSHGHHIIAIDYRGYGDSSKLGPTTRSVVQDATEAFKYVNGTTANPVFLWGHSLGTGIGTHLLATLEKSEMRGPRTVVLEAPFNNIRDEISSHPMAIFYKKLPWFDFTIVTPMASNGLEFESDRRILEFRQPVLILHAEDDRVVPFDLGYRLYRVALERRPKSWGPVQFHRFSKSSGYGHKFIVRAPDLADLTGRFFDAYRNEVY